jgi:hypothetical protein
MSILDDAIREHLELKRAHGADESELKKLEDEAFGPPARPEPDPFAEAPTEFMGTPEASPAAGPAVESSRRRIDIADLQEAPAPAEAPPVPAEDVAQAAPPAEEEPPPEEALAEDAATGLDEAPAAEERQAIAEQPTEYFDVAAEMEADEAPAAAGEPAAAAAAAPADEEIVEAEMEEPKLAPVAEEEEEDEEFWSEQRLSDELDQALEAPLSEQLEDEEREEGEPEEDPPPHADYNPDTGHEDVLEDTPDFLEDAPEDDDLWFEQRPPKDFDLDD